MLKQKGRQLSITDIDVLEQWSNRPLVSENSIYYALAEADDIFSDELFSSAYSHKGRPATSPAMLTKVLLLQFYENVSDRQAEERALYDLRWKVALHLPIGESGFDHSTLSNFRDRLLQNKKEQEVFQKILEKAAERKLIPQNSVRQIIDSTCTLGAGAVQDTYILIRKSIYKLIQELQKKINIVEIAKEPLKLNYQDDSKPKIDWNNPEERNQLLNDLISDAEKLLSAIESHKLSPKGQQLKEVLSKIVEQDIQRQEDGTVIIKQGVAKDRIISTSDPEMRHGRKSSSRLFDGYKTHTAMEEESEFITAVEVTPGNQHDSEAATKLIEAQPKEQQPETIKGDTAYGTGQVRAAMEDKQIK
ncbi:Transposase [Desulforamulus putei DSM 12395]|uniref:Transposase n=1 Tax=Desulforamulus putei DSM 12395 TaxID=1121429 RepID=A0A1M5BAM5_9FIRM|nr:transposase [Desulforamulus putei]SHF39377.1 Transposase [Desulforamulus putei DSM 12395]